MDAKTRRKKIIEKLQASETPISASVLAKNLSVSRQIIVGDVALLRAENHPIEATPRGYVLGLGAAAYPFIGALVCKHGIGQVEEELTTIVDYGGTCLDVAIEHSLYGELIGKLNISSRYDVTQFMEQIRTSDKPLSLLSNGLHTHHIGCKDEETFHQIQNALYDLSIALEKHKAE